MEEIKTWLRTNTYQYQEFVDMTLLMARKRQTRLSVSVAIPTLNEEKTIAQVVSCLKHFLMDQAGFIDELVVIDSGSTDKTRERAIQAGARVYLAKDILPDQGHFSGKGENLWKAVHQLQGDIVVFIDGDITNIHPRFVTGLVGPLLYREELGYVKACYERSQSLPGMDSQGGRVTEILVRPFFTLFFPQLCGVIQPLAGEFAARRAVLDRLPFPVGYGVEAAHLVDILNSRGLGALAQTDMGGRSHRHRSNQELGRMAYAILQVLTRRLSAPELTAVVKSYPPLWQYSRKDAILHSELFGIKEEERPPLIQLHAYQQRHPQQPGDRVTTPGFSSRNADLCV